MQRHAAQRPRRWLLGLTAASAVWMSTCVAPSWSQANPDALVQPRLAVTEIDAKIDQLTAEFRNSDLTVKKGDAIRNAILQDDYAAAGEVLGRLREENDPKAWAVSPLTEALDHFALSASSDFGARLEKWRAKSDKDPWPLVLQARLSRNFAWGARGEGFAKDVDQAAMSAFERYVRAGLAEIRAAMKLDDRDPYDHVLELRLLQDEGLSDELENAFQQAIARFPNHLPFYDIMLTALEPKWGGSVDEMYAFIDRFAGGADKDSPLKLLYLNLYGDLIDAAGGTCYDEWEDRPKMQACVDVEMRKLVRPKLEDHVVEALNLYDRLDKYQFSLWLDRTLPPMIWAGWAPKFAGAVLELAAKSLHSQTEILADADHKNNYVIDRAVAQVWTMQENYQLAAVKDQDAIGDVEKADFLSAAAKAKAIAALYGSLSQTYEALHRYPEMIAYESAALVLDGINDRQYTVCSGYFELGQYEQVIRACSGSVLFDKNPRSAYYRGRANFEMGKFDEALRDMTIVADSSDSPRSSAAIVISHILLIVKKDNLGAIEELKKYKYLFDPKLSDVNDVAVAYNNLCYAYMQLGRDQEALENCTNSLKFASLPDAYAKQRLLVERLAANQNNPLREQKN